MTSPRRDLLNDSRSRSPSAETLSANIKPDRTHQLQAVALRYDAFAHIEVDSLWAKFSGRERHASRYSAALMFTASSAEGAS
jgi:hypothetical protein